MAEKKICLPHYIVDKDGEAWRIWDTVDHRYTDDKPHSKAEAETRAKELNKGD